MSVMEDLISFDVIETQKENIQSLPQGRSAKALAAQFAPNPFSPIPTPGATRSLNDAIRQEYETELQAIADADDPLDIYDRYVKWTMNAYPSAQATPESQLRQLLERATKSFQGSAQYKNDVRYLKLWLNYIRFFSDAPREVYAYLSRHGIGDGLALFYEEFAAWLESAGRWTQAEEVYKLGIDKEARPAERLLRKFDDFRKRSEARSHNADEPTSPALPTVRPALAAKLDPFASSTSSDPQSRRGISSSSSSRTGRSKMAIFSDAGDSSSGSRPGTGDTSKGWDSIGSIAERRKENAIEPRSWAGETLKAGRKASGPKMMVFKDQPGNESRHVYISTKNGKTEKWFADILSVCPNEKDVKDEYCFEEMRARHRGWLNKEWTRASNTIQDKPSGRGVQRNGGRGSSDASMDNVTESIQSVSLGDDAFENFTQDTKKFKTKKKKLLEVRGETQTVKAILDSPATKPKLRRKKSSEVTMTLHTRAATDDVLDIFNQPLRNVGVIGSCADSDGDVTDYDPDDYTCGVSSVGDNTRTGNISDTESVYNDDVTGYQSDLGSAEVTRPDSVSPWSEFNTKKHVPNVDDVQKEAGASSDPEVDNEHDHEMQTPIEASAQEEAYNKFIPMPPEGIEAPKIPFRTAEQAAQSRLPFMTPIVERTESSLGLPTVRSVKETLQLKTPSRRRGDATETIPELESPFQEIVTEYRLPVRDKDAPTRSFVNELPTKPLVGFRAPVIQDSQFNPHDDTIREQIMARGQLSAISSYCDKRHIEFGRGNDIRRFIRSLQKTSRPSTDRTAQLPPTLQFSEQHDQEYTIRRELGKGAYAPVYLASVSAVGESGNSSSFVAIKSETPPSAWEYFILSALYCRLALENSRRLSSITKPFAFHHFADEVYLLESYHDQGTLLDLVNVVRSEPGSSGLEESVAMFFAVELLRTMGAMHSVGILHGDLKADNCLVRLDGCSSESWSVWYDPSGSDGWSAKGLALIDFGRGIDMTAFKQDVGFLADWKTSKDDCVEMRELRPWTHQVDYWGAAGVLHVLLFGKWIEDTPAGRDRITAGDHENGVQEEKTMVIGKAGLQKRRLKEGLKRYWQTDLWTEAFDLLMNPTSWTDSEKGDRLPANNRLDEVTRAMEQWLVENSERKGLRTQLKKLEDRIKEKRRKD